MLICHQRVIHSWLSLVYVQPLLIAKWPEANHDFQLKKPLEYGSQVRPILLAPVADHYQAGTRAMVTGWGVTKRNGRLSDQLRKVEVPLVSNADCAELYGFRPITRRMICAGYVNFGGKDACQVIAFINRSLDAWHGRRHASLRKPPCSELIRF